MEEQPSFQLRSKTIGDHADITENKDNRERVESGAGGEKNREKVAEHQDHADAKDGGLAGRRDDEEKGGPREVHTTKGQHTYHRTATKSGRIHVQQGKGKPKREIEQTHAQAEKQSTTQPMYYSGRP